ncbi:MAG TPA: papain-like cysteine protease family protein [Ramlibacter sp.]|nr:papain-like cysteine protease family protein [Ramlibacter sp.]
MRKPGNVIRAALAVTVFLFIVSMQHTAAAAVSCKEADAAGVRRCKAGLAPEQVRVMQRTQERSQWCWAAAVAMVLAHNGVSLGQEDVVRQHFGQVADMKVAGSAMTQLLMQPRRDASGAQAIPAVAVGDVSARRFDLDIPTLVRELVAGRPLVFAVNGHAMVLVEVVFDEVPGRGVRVVGGSVIDPAPGRGLRTLLTSEMRPSYVAAVQMRRAADDTMVAMR